MADPPSGFTQFSDYHSVKKPSFVFIRILDHRIRFNGQWRMISAVSLRGLLRRNFRIRKRVSNACPFFYVGTLIWTNDRKGELMARVSANGVCYTPSLSDTHWMNCSRGVGVRVLPQHSEMAFLMAASER